jgi:hypothetical protein
MPDIINLTCPSCGGKLQITNDIDRFACGFCGNELLVQRGGGIVTLAPVVAELKNVQAGVDKTASELAIARLTGEINNLVAQREHADNAKSIRYMFAVIFALPGIILFASWVSMVSQNGFLEDGAAKGVVFVLAILLGGIGYWIYSSTKVAVNKTIGPINQIIGLKLKELERHQVIVKGG